MGAHNYAFSIDLKDAYLHIHIVNLNHHFLHYVWQHKPYLLKVCHFAGYGPLGFHLAQ